MDVSGGTQWGASCGMERVCGRGGIRKICGKVSDECRANIEENSKAPGANPAAGAPARYGDSLFFPFKIFLSAFAIYFAFMWHESGYTDVHAAIPAAKLSVEV